MNSQGLENNRWALMLRAYYKIAYYYKKKMFSVEFVTIIFEA